jgi:hypothetical protein
MSVRALTVSLAAALVLGALVIGAVSFTETTTGAPDACGAAAPTVLAGAAGQVARRIYEQELQSPATDRDKRQIENQAQLISALQSGDRSAIDAAVHSLVYSHTHIVRLRVSRAGKLLSDIGGPYIIAPVSGRLRVDGRTLAKYVFSVQDDLGYAKLVKRFIGAPLVLRTDSGQVPIPELLSPGPASIPDRGPVDYHGATYEAYSFNAKAYPSGRLRVSLLLLPVSAALASHSCDEIVATEMGLVAQRISRRLTLSGPEYIRYVKLVGTFTHALVYVRIGPRTLAGSVPAVPNELPDSGSLTIRGVDYEISSFPAPTSAGQARVYVLVDR